MSGIDPWIPVEPNNNPAAILGPLPFRQGAVSYSIPTNVAPANAGGILVFAWATLRGKNAPVAYWHMASAQKKSPACWFSLFISGDATGNSIVCNSQAFWLPYPADGKLTVTLHLADLTSPTNRGQVEIHGYYPAAAP